MKGGFFPTSIVFKLVLLVAVVAVIVAGPVSQALGKSGNILDPLKYFQPGYAFGTEPYDLTGNQCIIGIGASGRMFQNVDCTSNDGETKFCYGSHRFQTVLGCTEHNVYTSKINRDSGAVLWGSIDGAQVKTYNAGGDIQYTDISCTAEYCYNHFYVTVPGGGGWKVLWTKKDDGSTGWFKMNYAESFEPVTTHNTRPTDKTIDCDASACYVVEVSSIGYPLNSPPWARVWRITPGESPVPSQRFCEHPISPTPGGYSLDCDEGACYVQCKNKEVWEVSKDFSQAPVPRASNFGEDSSLFSCSEDHCYTIYNTYTHPQDVHIHFDRVGKGGGVQPSPICKYSIPKGENDCEIGGFEMTSTDEGRNIIKYFDEMFTAGADRSRLECETIETNNEKRDFCHIASRWGGDQTFDDKGILLLKISAEGTESKFSDLQFMAKCNSPILKSWGCNLRVDGFDLDSDFYYVADRTKLYKEYKIRTGE